MKKLTGTILLVLSMAVLTFGQQAATVKGELLIKLAPDAKPWDIARDVYDVLGMAPELKPVYEVSDYMRIWLFSFNEDAISKNEMIRHMNSVLGVEVAQANHIIESRLTPNDAFFGQQWYHKQNNDKDIDSDLAWDITTGGVTATGDDIVVCVVEPSGAKWDHVDLIDNHWVNVHEIPNNGIDDDLNGYVDDYDGWNVSGNNDNLNTGNHGTQVSSMIGAKGNNGTGISGVNWNVKIMQVQIASVSESGVIAAYNYPLKMRKLYNQTNGAKGAFVVATNSSWGTDNGQPANAPLWCAMYDSLGTYGILSCGSTANNNVNVDVVGDLPTACPSNYLISVTASNNNDVRTFSGYGITTIDLAAPGENVYLAGNNSYGNTSGTSFASPCVAGAVGLLYSAPCASFMQIAYANPALAAGMMKGYIMNGVDPVNNLANEVLSGGRLNVKNALDLMLNNCAAGGCFAPFSLTTTNQSGTLNYTLAWGSISEGSTFTVRYRVVGSPSWTTVSNLTQTQTTLNNLLPCANYEAQVSANCGAETSDWSPLSSWNTVGCCVHPTGYTVTNQSNGNVLITWDAIYGNPGFNITLTPSSGTPQTFNNIPTNQYVFNSLEPCATYNVVISSTCTSPTNSPLTFTLNTSGCGSCDDLEYCAVTADASLEFIRRVALGNIDRTSVSDGGYIKVADQTTTLQAGSSYQITLRPGYTGFQYPEYFKVWIDYNADGTFSSSELVYDAGTTTTVTITGNFTVPSNVQPGIVRMRVGMSYLSAFGSGNQPSPCGNNGDGETEDYCVTITNTVSTTEITESNTITVYPNPVQDVLTVNGASGSMVNNFSIYDTAGRFIRTASVRNFGGVSTLEVADLTQGCYILSVENDNGTISRTTFMKQ